MMNTKHYWIQSILKSLYKRIKNGYQQTSLILFIHSHILKIIKIDIIIGYKTQWFKLNLFVCSFSHFFFYILLQHIMHNRNRICFQATVNQSNNQYTSISIFRFLILSYSLSISFLISLMLFYLEDNMIIYLMHRHFSFKYRILL